MKHQTQVTAWASNSLNTVAAALAAGGVFWAWSMNANAQTAAQASTQSTAQSTAAVNNEALRKLLEERMGVPKIDELTRAPAGLIEVRIGNEIYYTDPAGNFLIAGNLIDLRNRENLTQARIEKLTAIEWKDLPFKDAVKIVRGNGGAGKRDIAVFEDPNCGYCRVLHQHLAKVDNSTIYVFLYPILSPDSTEKAKQIWCSPNRSKAYLDWMLERKAPTSAASCDTTAINRITDLGRKHKVQGTPALVFMDGARVPGAIPPDQIEKRLATAR
jgi:thiol:disulfide interchange protein DsbC